MSTSRVSVILIGAFPQTVTLIKGGIQASVYGLAKTFSMRSDVEAVRIFALPLKNEIHTHGRKEVDGLDVTYLKSYPLMIMSIVHLPTILCEIPTSAVVHVHGTGLLQTALLTALRLMKRKFVWTLHGITAKETLQRFYRQKTLGNLLRHLFYTALEKLSALASSHTIVDTPYVIKETKLKGKVSAIPIGVFPEEFVQASHGSCTSLVLSVGVLSPRKGHHHTIEAFSKVVEKIPEAQLVIAGAKVDGAYHESLIHMIKCLKLEDHVRLRVNVPRAELLSLYAGARIFALHSQEESQGIVFCEALTAGLPVVATEVGGIPYIITHEKEGLLVRLSDVNAYADAMTRLLQDNALYKRMASDAKASSHRFDWKNIADEVMIVYQTL